MKSYSTVAEFIIGLIGVIIHSIIVIFLVSYMADPGQLELMIEQTTGAERALLEQFVEDVNRLGFMVYVGAGIVIMEWIALFQILKRANSKTPIWAFFLILGSLYAYFYFGGLEVFILLLVSGVLTIYRYKKHLKQ